MRILRLAKLPAAATATVLLAAGVLGATAGTGTAHAAVVRPAATSARHMSYAVTGQLNGVAATRHAGTWAVGYSGSSVQHSKTLILRWNGRKWVRSPGFRPISGALTAVTIVSRSDAWAVGYTGSAFTPHTLLMHWNGRKWLRVTSPRPVRGTLNAVTATARYGWAVGGASRGAGLAWRLTGKRWHATKVPTDPKGVNLDGVAQSSAGSAWATSLGNLQAQITGRLLRWNGKTWHWASFPVAGTYHYLNAIAAGPHRTAFAVGTNNRGISQQALSMRYTGRAWVKTRVLRNANFQAVAEIPGSSAWAVGSTSPKPGKMRSLAARWNGRSWARIATPAPPARGYSELLGIAAVSRSDAWAVGFAGVNSHRTLILHWNGRAWR